VPQLKINATPGGTFFTAILLLKNARLLPANLVYIAERMAYKIGANNKRRANKMTEHKSIHAALFAFQCEAPMVQKTADNPFFKSKYADLPAIWDTIRELTAKHGLLVTNTVAPMADIDYITTTLTHVPTGQKIESTLPINPAKRDPQGYGAAMTYHRRQNLVAMLGLVCELDDDDGNEASKPAPKKPEPEPVKTMTDDEFHILKTAVAESITTALLDQSKAKAKAGWKRMSPEQRDQITKLIGAMDRKINPETQTPLDA